MGKTFIMYKDWIDYTTDMSMEEKGLFLQTILLYQNEQDIGDITPIKFVWSRVKKQLDEDSISWNIERQKRSEAGKLGGLAKASNAKHSLASLADTVTVTVTDTVNGNENITNNYKGDEVYMQAGHLSITHDEFTKLSERFGEEKSDDLVRSILNYRKNTKYKSLYLTAINWGEKEVKKKNAPAVLSLNTVNYD